MAGERQRQPVHRAASLDALRGHDFGVLDAYAHGADTAVDVFDAYRSRALARINALRAGGMADRNIAAHLYGIRNSLAHGKDNALLGRAIDVSEVARDVPIVKLLARFVIERVP